MNPITETLEKFNNGEQRYQDDQNFKEAVDSLAAKIGVYAVLDKTLNQLRVLREIHANNTNSLAIEGGRSRRLAGEADNLRAYTAEVEKANADWVEAHDKLKEEANNLRASNRSLIESNMALTERLRDYESR